MTLDTIQTTAKIYQFPVGGRASLSRREPAKAIDNLPRVSVGSGWYHDAAIEEANHGSEH